MPAHGALAVAAGTATSRRRDVAVPAAPFGGRRAGRAPNEPAGGAPVGAAPAAVSASGRR